MLQAVPSAAEERQLESLEQQVAACEVKTYCLEPNSQASCYVASTKEHRENYRRSLQAEKEHDFHQPAISESANVLSRGELLRPSQDFVRATFQCLRHLVKCSTSWRNLANELQVRRQGSKNHCKADASL